MAVCWDSANCHCFATSDPRKGRFAACGPKSMCVDAGLFPYLVLTSFWTSFFSFIRAHPAVYKLGKGPASRFCLWASTVPTKKGPFETGVPMRFDQKRIEHNRTIIVWSRLVKASVSNGERGFARSVPGQGSWRAFWLGIAVKRKHCKDLGVWVYLIQTQMAHCCRLSRVAVLCLEMFGQNLRAQRMDESNFEEIQDLELQIPWDGSEDKVHVYLE